MELEFIIKNAFERGKFNDKMFGGHYEIFIE